jgi:hypothetical protein
VAVKQMLSNPTATELLLETGRKSMLTAGRNILSAIFHTTELGTTRNYEYLILYARTHSELLCFWTLSIVRNFKYYKTQRFGSWICFRPKVRGGR